MSFTFYFHALEKEMATHSCSCLENPRDGGARWAAVYGVTQSWTWLKWLSSSSKHIIRIVSHNKLSIKKNLANTVSIMTSGRIRYIRLRIHKNKIHNNNIRSVWISQPQIDSCHGCPPSTSARIESRAAAATDPQRPPEGVQGGEQKWGPLMLLENWQDRSVD